MNREKSILVYDGSFEGMLTCIFTVFEQKLCVSSIYVEQNVQQHMFSTPVEILTESDKAERVKKGLLTKIGASAYRQLYFAYLSESLGIEMKILEYAQLAFRKGNFSPKNYGEPVILWMAQTAKKVSREKHRMEAFVRFKLTKDKIYFSQIEPDFNVLPVILKHFESRYADQKWLIFDKRRNYGLFYDLNSTSYITFENYQIDNNKERNESIFDIDEIEFEDLWRNYFNSINIKSRKNIKLHIKHVPKRYWKYLSEKKSLDK